MRRIYLLLVTAGLILLVIGVGLLVAGYFFRTALEVPTVAVPTQLASSTGEYVVGYATLTTLPDIVPNNYECTLTTTGEYVEGTAFIADKNLRVDLLDSNNALTTYVATTTGEMVHSPYSINTTTVSTLLVGYRCWLWVPDLSVFEIRML